MKKRHRMIFDNSVIDYEENIMNRKKIILVGVICASFSLLIVAGGLWKGFSHNDIAGKPALKARADTLKRTVVTAHLQQEIKAGTNVLWCSTFQLAWNELCALAGEPIRMENEPAMVEILNKKSVTTKDIDQASCVATAGVIRDGIIDRIKKELEQKFQGKASPDLLQSAEDLPPDFWVAYSYLFKMLPFKYAFVSCNKPLILSGSKIASFGIEQKEIQNDDTRKKLESQVMVLDRTGNDDFILELKNESRGDRLILAKVAPGKTIGETIQNVRKRMAKGKPQQMALHANLQVPVLNFDILKEYKALCGKPVISKNSVLHGSPIGIALQSIRFKLDRNGAILKSEGLMAKGGSAGPPPEYIFDKPFLLLLERERAENPYFALWVDNAELLVKY